MVSNLLSDTRAMEQGIYKAWKEQNRLLAYFTSGWLWVGISSTALMVTCNSVWWIFVLRYARTFNINIRYNVYKDISAQARILELNGSGEGLTQAMKDFMDLGFLVQTLSWYYALNGMPTLWSAVWLLKQSLEHKWTRWPMPPTIQFHSLRWKLLYWDLQNPTKIHVASCFIC